MQPIIDDEATEKGRLIRLAWELFHKTIVDVDSPEWKFLLEKGGIKVWTRPAPKSTSFLRSRTIIQCAPSMVFQYIIEAEKRNQWDKIYTTQDIAVLDRGEKFEIRLQKRHFRIFSNMGTRQRVYPHVSYSGAFPNVENGFINCNTTVESPLVPIRDNEVAMKINCSGFMVLPHGTSHESSIVVHFADCDPKLNNSLWEKWVSPIFSKMAPHFEVDRMRHLTRTLESPKSKRGIPRSLFPPVLPMKDLSWMSPDPADIITKLARYYLSRENASNWETAVVDRRVVVQRFTEPSIVPGNDIILKLNFKSDCWIRSMRCFVDSDKRVQWEQCGTNVVELWNDGLDHEIIEVQGGGPGRGYGCTPFSYVAHVYHMLVPANNAGLSLLAFEERDNGDILLAKFPLPHDPVHGQRRASYFDEVSVLFIMKSANSLPKSKVYPRSAFAHTLPLSPVEYLLLESIIELRNVLEVDAWVTTNNQLLKLSMDDEETSDGDFSHKKLPAIQPGRGEKRNSLSIVNLDEDELESMDFDGADTNKLKERVRSFKRLSPSLSAGTLFPTTAPFVLPALSLLDTDADISENSSFSSSPSLISRLVQPHSPHHSLSRGSSGSDVEIEAPSAGIENLPGWVFEQILLLLGAHTTLRVCSVVCRRWNKMCNSENIWREFVKWDFMSHSLNPRAGAYAGYYKARHASKGKKAIKDIDNLLGSLKGWRKRYCEFEKTQISWASGLAKFGEVASFKKQGITHISVSPTLVAVGHQEGGISGHSLVGGNQVFTYSGPQNSSVVCTAINGGSDIVALYNTGVVSVYERNSKSVILQHNLSSCVGGSISQNHAVTFNEDDVVKLWDVNKGENVWTLDKVDNESVTIVSLQGSRCGVGAFLEDFQVGFLKLVDSNTGQIITSFAQAHDGPISTIHFEENGQVAFTGSKDGNLKLWDARAGTNYLENYWHKKCGVTSIYTGQNKLVSGTTDRKVWYWDMRNPRHEVVCKYSPGVKGCVNQLYIMPDFNTLLASWDNGILSSWKFT